MGAGAVGGADGLGAEDGPAGGDGRLLLAGTNSWFAVGGPLDDAGAGGCAVGRACIGWRIVAAEDCAAPGAPVPPEGAGRVGSVLRTVAEGSAPATPMGSPPLLADTVGSSDSSVPLADPPRFAEPLPARDTWSG